MVCCRPSMHISSLPLETGDSFDDTFMPPKKLTRALQKWVKSSFGQQLNYTGNSMDHGSQTDGYSCRIILGNTIAHAAMCVPIWEHHRSIVERLQWFQCLATGDRYQENQMASHATSQKATKMLEENPELSVAVALGDHNFPDLVRFALGSDDDSDGFPRAPEIEHSSAKCSAPSLADLLNPVAGLEADKMGSVLELAEGVVDRIVEDTLSCTSEPRTGEMTAATSDGDLLTVQAPGDGNMMPEDDAVDFDITPGHVDQEHASVGIPNTLSDSDSMDVDDNAQMKKRSTLHKYFRSVDDIDHIVGQDKQREHQMTADEEDWNGPGSKRWRVASETDSSEESENYQRAKVITGKGPRLEGKSRSAKASRARREKLRRGELHVDERDYEKWKQKLLTNDPHVEFHPKDIRQARHLICGEYVLMKDACDATRWHEHLKKCVMSSKKRKPSGGTRSLLKMGFESMRMAAGSQKHNKTEPAITCPCPGITEIDDPRLPIYLRRTGVLGGGARSVKVIAGEIYNKLHSKLGRKGKQRVLDAQQHEQKWRNDHQNLRVFAVDCEHTVPVPGPAELPKFCATCGSVFASGAFKNALRKPPPDEKNYIFTNHRFRSPVLGKIYARTVGLKDLIETPVRDLF